MRSGYRTVVAWGRRGEAERAAYNLARVKAEMVDGVPIAHEPGVSFAAASLREGFLAPSLKLAVLPEHRLLQGSPRGPARRARGPAGGGALAAFTDLRAGSAVVHEDHGVARFTGFETRTVGGITRDYLQLEFAGGDRVFVPSDQLHKISRYVGAEAGDPPLSKLGGKAWERMKSRARKAAQALAGELINLYAERKRRSGHPFPQDGEWQIAFEDAFPFRETPDQMEAIEAVKADMEEARPDGPPDLRRRGLRQDRGGAAGGVQGGRRRPPGHVPGAHHRARPAALRHLRRAAARLPVQHRGGLALSLRRRAARGAQGLRRGQGGHPHRHPPPALARRAAQATSAC